jgi:hypothetical protein
MSHWIGSEICDASRFDGKGPIEYVLVQMEKTIIEYQRIISMDVVVRGKPMHWRVTHHMNV